MKKILLVVAAVAMLATGRSGAQGLAERVAPPDKEVIAIFEAAGMREVRPHVLTHGEHSRIEQVLAGLPALHRSVLEKRLRHLSFVDGIPGHGTGLTSPVEGSGQFDITLRASLFDETLSGFLTNKERRLFEADGSGRTVTVEATGMDALAYVLLHEASHVVDATLGLSTKPGGAFASGIWQDRTTLAPALATSQAMTTSFRRGPLVPVGRSDTIYDALARTPFVSLYATAAAPEDLAELVTWREIAQQRKGSLTITISDADGNQVKRYEPLAFPAVKARMERLGQLLREAG